MATAMPVVLVRTAITSRMSSRFNVAKVSLDQNPESILIVS